MDDDVEPLEFSEADIMEMKRLAAASRAKKKEKFSQMCKGKEAGAAN